MLQRVFLPGSVTAIVNLAALGLLVGWGGASRAISVGPETLLNDHAGAVAVAALIAVLLAGMAGARFTSGRQVAFVLVVVAAIDLVAALGAVIAIPEIQLAHLPRALAAETALGIQLVAVATGSFLGYWLRGHRASAA